MMQEIGVYFIVAAAVCYLLRTAWTQATGAKKGCGSCGSNGAGSGCGSAPQQAPASSGLIQITLNTSNENRHAAFGQTRNPES